MKNPVFKIFSGLLILVTPISHAAEIEISGYATFKAIANSNSDGVSYNRELAKTSYTNFDTRESNVGVQLYTDISPKLDMTVVLSTRGGAQQKFNVETEWAYANYKFSSDLSLRIGKVKGPFYMVSDYKDVGYAYPWVSPPEEVYSTNPIRSVNGLDIVYQTTSNNVTYLGEVYIGSGTSTTYLLPNAVAAGALAPFGFDPTAAPATQADFITRNMLGFNTSITYEGISLRLGYFKTKVDFGPLTNLDGAFGGIGITVDVDNIVIYSEYIVRDTGPELAIAFPDQTASYVTAGYRINDYLPYVTVAKLDKGKDASPYSLKQDSTALGLRVEIDESAALKFEIANKKPGGTGSYGLYDAPLTGTGTIYTVAVDLLF